MSARVRLPKLVIYGLTVAAACIVASRHLPEYQRILQGIGTLVFGALMSYLAVTLPSGVVAAANEGRPPFRMIPEPGKLARRLFFVLGICLALFGASRLAGLV
jgi:hypothetical protein